jgi:hypothetical protein
MSQNDDDILTSEIGKVGAKAGELSGGNKLKNELNKAGGRLGAEFAAKRLPNDTFEMSTDITADPISIVSIITNILNNAGKLLDTREQSGTFEAKAVVGSGFRNMNPAVVTVTMNPISSGQVHIVVQGTAKEGLIKQHAGEKAARLIAQSLVDAF